jgi:hypothetical protein
VPGTLTVTRATLTLTVNRQQRLAVLLFADLGLLQEALTKDVTRRRGA